LVVRDANRVLKLRLPEHEGFTTIAGFLMAQAGRLLNEGDAINYDGRRFIVERLEGRRIRRVRLLGKTSANIPVAKPGVGSAMISLLTCLSLL
jgi:CBS domain containing-hemolysin-like protein